MRSLLPRVCLAAAAGALWACCFGRQPFSLSSWIVLAPLLLLLSSPQAGRLAFVHGFVFWVVALAWIPQTLVTFGKIPLPGAIPLTGLLAAFLAGFQAVFGWLGGPIWRRWPVARLALLPALWVALEWLRTFLFGGFPWNLAAYAWVDVAGALPLAAAVGPYGISFLVLLTSTGAAAAWERRRPEPMVVAFVVPLLLLPIAGRWSLRRSETDLAAARSIAGPGEPVRLLQPNIPNLVDWDPSAIARNYRKVLRLSAENCEPGALVVWPESAGWPFQYHRDEGFDDDLHAMVERGCSLLFNSGTPVPRSVSPDAAGEQFYNSAFLLLPDGSEERYDKRHLVPFGEYVPFRGLFWFIDKLAREAGEFRPADRTALLPWGREKLGMAICYEIVFPGEVAGLVRRGATVLVTITNDAWYGDTWAPWQHFRAARFRAAENRRPLLRAAITGVSALVGPDGSVWAQLGVFREGVIRGRVLGGDRLTLYTRAPWAVPLLCALLALGGVGLERSRRRRGRE
jgi:apolipoprotein N-acyltransferase